MNDVMDHEHGPNLDGMSIAQKAVVALDYMPDLMKEAQERKTSAPRGPGRPESATGKAAAKAAKIVGIGQTSVETTLAIQKRNPAVIERMRSGELNVAQAAREVGMVTRGGKGRGDGMFDSGLRDVTGRVMPSVYYGKGDKWKEAVGPLLRYLSAWERKGYEFRHVAPKEARRRLALIAELETKLDAAKADLEQRAHSATLTITKKG